MTYEEYQRETKFLRRVLKDALERGDYHLEHDIYEKLETLEQTYQEE